MKKFAALVLALSFIFALSGCEKEKEEQPTENLGEAYEEHLAGTVSDIYTEGGGADTVHVLELEIDRQSTLYITVPDTEVIEGVEIGDEVEVDCTRHTKSGYCLLNSIEVTGGEEETGEIVTEPPVLTVISGDIAAEARRGSYSWTVFGEDDMSVGTIACGVHTLELKDELEPLTFSGSAAYLQFEILPDKVSVICWDESCWGDTSAEGETLSADLTDGEYIMQLKSGSYIYQITAEWTSYETFEGEAEYSFCSEK